MRPMFSGQSVKEHNFWVSKLRDYKRHTPKQSRIPLRGFTLHSSEEHVATSDPVTRDPGSPTMTSTDLQQCVHLLTSLLEDEASALGLSAKKMHNRKTATKPKKTVVSKSKGVLCPRNGVDAKVHASRRAKNGRKANAHKHGLKGKQGPATPYNARLASSTPNNTLLQGISTKRNPGLPLVTNASYSLTSGQSHPLNASDQVNLIQPPLPPDPEPKLFSGKVEFQPNPSNWFRTHPGALHSAPLSHVDTNTLGYLRPDMTGNYYVPQYQVMSGVPGLVQAHRDVNIAEKENAADAFSLYSDHQEATRRKGDQHAMQTRSQDVMSHNQPGQVTDNIGQSKGQGSSDPGHADKETGNNGLTLRNPKFREAILSLKSALRQEAMKAAYEETGKLPVSSVSKPRTRKPKIKKDDSVGTCPRCCRHEKRKQNKKESEDQTKSTAEEIPKAAAEYAEVATQISTPDVAVSPRPTKEPDQNITPELQVSQNSQQHMKTLQHLLKQLQATPGSQHDIDLHSLVTQIEQTAAMFVPGLGGMDWQMEVELAMQPLRSENAQLRRKLRILNQQNKDKSSDTEQSDKPGAPYDVVHLELQRSSLEQELKESKAMTDHLKDRLQASNTEVEHLRKEKGQLMDILANKDADRQMLEQSLTAEVQRHKSDAAEARKASHDATQQKGAAQGQLELMRVEVDERDREIKRLRGLVKNLQGSMTKLLGNLKALSPQSGSHDLQATSHHGNHLSDIQGHLRDICSIGLDHHGNTPPKTVGGSENCTTKVTPSACRALPFSGHHGNQTKPTSAGAKPPKTLGGKQPVDLNITSSPKVPGKDKDATKPVSNWTDDELDSTEYLMAPGSSAIKVRPMTLRHHAGTRSEGMETPVKHDNEYSESDAPTVKELLTPLANRLQNQYKRLSLGGAMVPSTSSGSQNRATVKTVPEEGPDPESSLEVAPLEGDSTLTETLPDTDPEDVLPPGVSGVNSPGHVHGKITAPDNELSRYSMTDYFRKYSGSTKSDFSGSNDAKPSGPNPDHVPIQEDISDQLSQHTDNFTSFEITDTHIASLTLHDIVPADDIERSAWSPRDRSLPHISFQDSLYRGTELDTSISTIDDILSVASSALTVSSTGTVDDSAFRQGLADLDANIARIQQQLKVNLC